LRDPRLVFRRRDEARADRIPVESASDTETRSLEAEMKLNRLAAQLFTTGGGREFLDYLQSITMHRLVSARADAGTLYYYEGARWIVGVVKARVAAGQKEGRIGYVPPEIPEDPLEP
jgi:hypothetical protein